MQCFSDRSKSLPPVELERPTIMKNDLSNLGRMNVLACDQKFILDLFMQSVLDVNQDLDMTIVPTFSKFGQKDHRWFDLHSLVDGYGVTSVLPRRLQYPQTRSIHPSLLFALWTAGGGGSAQEPVFRLLNVRNSEFPE